jgi:uncharacterized protein with von Willebrand factor type A (vWA) domain
MTSSATDPLERLTRFGRALRREGLSVGSGRILEFSRAAALLAPDDLYWAGRATLIARPEDIPVYDRVFGAFFGGDDPGVRTAPAAEPPVVKTTRPGAPSAPGDEHLKAEVSLASPVELLRRKNFADCTPDELEALIGALNQMLLPTRRSRRYRPTRAGVPDFRRTLRASFRTAGEPVNRAWRQRRHVPRRVVLLLDVSGSMATYSRALLFFAHAGVKAHRRWEAFCFATRLTRVTRALASGTPDEALMRASSEVLDFDGGTRIGESLKRFLDDHGHRGMARGAVVIVCSDGLDLGDPQLVGEQMQRLSRLAHRIVWLNPLKEDPAYAPIARAMKAALPYIDVFASGHNLASLEALTDGLSRTVGPRAIGGSMPSPPTREDVVGST